MRILQRVAALSLVVLASIIAFPQSPRPLRVIHVIVALADNEFQGIVPVPAALGNGDDARRNLYWGAAGGVRTFFQRSLDWELDAPCSPRDYPLVERCVFRHKSKLAILVADAYRGREIKIAIQTFLTYAAGRLTQEVRVGRLRYRAGGDSDLVAYVGHDGLMNFALDHNEVPDRTKEKKAMILACASRQYFAEALRHTGAEPILWTTNLMAPEAYTLKAALDGWLNEESGEQIRERAAVAYDKYQHCGIKGARKLFATGW